MRVVAPLLDELHPAAHLDPAVAGRAHMQLRTDALADRERPAEPLAHEHRGRACGLVLGDPEVGREEASPHPPGGLVLPGPDVVAGLTHRRRHERLDLRGRPELVGLRDPRHPLRPRADPGKLAVLPCRDIAGDAADDSHVHPEATQQPRRTDRWMAGERQLGGRRVDPYRRDALDDPVDEDRLAEIQLVGDRLAPLRGNRTAVDEHAERIATAPVRTDEHPDDVEGRSCGAPIRRSATRWIPMIETASVMRPSTVIASASSNGTQVTARSSVAQGRPAPGTGPSPATPARAHR